MACVRAPVVLDKHCKNCNYYTSLSLNIKETGQYASQYNFKTRNQGSGLWHCTIDVLCTLISSCHINK